MNKKQPARLAVLISGNGSNLQVVLDACAAGELAAQVVVVVSNNADAFGLERARKVQVPAEIKVKQRAQDRRAYDAELAKVVLDYHPDWVILAGWMRILSSEFLESFPGRVINLHPALPGTFPGTHAIERAYDAYQHGQIEHTGVMVHLVPDEGVDCGPVLAQQVVPILPQDTLEALEGRIHGVEHHLIIEALASVLQSTSLSFSEK